MLTARDARLSGDERVDDGGHDSKPSEDNDDLSSSMQRCLNALREARNDSEQFAALLLVTKMLAVENTNARKRRRIFDAIGFTFINRLLLPSAASNVSTVNEYRSLGIAMLACFCTDSELVLNSQVLNKVHILGEILALNQPHEESEDLNLYRSVVDDCYQCFQGIIAAPGGFNHLLTEEVLSALCNALVRKSHSWEKGLQLLIHLLNARSSECWAKAEEDLSKVLKHLCVLFANSNDGSKFDICELLPNFLPPLEIFQKCTQCSECFRTIHAELFGVLNSKISGAQRDPALKLASAMINLYSLDWILPGNTTAKDTFFALIVNLACIEVRMCLEDTDSATVANKHAILIACYSILENTVALLTTAEHQFSRVWCNQIVTKMEEAFSAVIYYLKQQVLEEWIGDSFVFASVRVLGSWMAEENLTLKKEIMEIIPSLMQYSWKMQGNEAEPAAKTVEQNHCQFVSDQTVDPLRFLLPGLCHLTAEDDARKLLLEQNLHVLLRLAFQRQWELFRRLMSDEELQTYPDVEMTLRYQCSIFLNLVVTEPQFAKTDENFASLLTLLMDSLPLVIGRDCLLILAGNVCALSLMLIRVLDIPALSKATSQQFFTAIIDFLSKPYLLQKSTAEGEQSVVVMRSGYKECWEDISELWFLGMQGLGACLARLEWLPLVLLDSGWLLEILQLLANAETKQVAPDLLQSFQSLLTETSLHSSRCKDYVLQHAGRQLSDRYNMDSLKKALDH